MILTHFIMFRFFDGGSAADGGSGVNAAIYGKIHVGVSLSF